MIKKFGVLSISLLCFAAFMSCEKDFSDVGTSIISNSKFETGEILLDVAIEPIDVTSVQADNLQLGQQGGVGLLGEYWLGVYNNPNAKKIEASIVSRLAYNASELKTQETIIDGDTIYNLDKVILRLPYQATAVGNLFRLDSILGDPSLTTSIQVLRNETFLHNLNPSDPSKTNTYMSDADYEGATVLNEGTFYDLKPKATDTIFVYDKIDRSISLTNTSTFKDTISVTNAQGRKIPFLAIPLDLAEMKDIFWDKFDDPQFSSSDEFQNYFRGIKVVATGNDGSLVPFDFTLSPVIDFHYTQSIVDGTTVKDTLNNKYTFPLASIINSKYTMGTAPTVPANNFVLQGTAGSMAKITILDNTKLQELRDNKWLVNDASLSFYVNQTTNTDKDLIPQRLFLYQDKENSDGSISPTQISDAFTEAATFGGSLELTEDDAPEKYVFRINDYISRLLIGETNTTNEPLILKVFNPTDTPSNSAAVKSYNWNPRAVTLLDGNETANGTKRAVLKISYTKEK